MPKIFALRDRLQAVQEYLNDNEEELEIFPEKQHFSKGSFQHTKHLKSSLPLVESETNCVIGENDQGLFGEELGAEKSPLSSDEYIEEGCNNTKNDFNLKSDVTINVSRLQIEENPEEKERNNYQIKSAIETSINENNLPEKSQETSTYVPLNGKSNY